MEKIAVSSEGPDMDARVDPRFGRAAGFIIIDPDTMAFEYVDNGSSQVMAQGAGIQAAEIVAATGARVLLTGFRGTQGISGFERRRHYDWPECRQPDRSRGGPAFSGR
jgi:predicted Fe-Mo cluster-binding NifX family protein